MKESCESIENFKHKIEETVKFHEVDLMGICNNAVYFNYFEDARIKYIQDLKSKYNLKSLLHNNSFFIMAHNECDYILPAKFDDKLFIYTRIYYAKNSSIGFSHLVVKQDTLEIIASGKGVLVHIDISSKTKMPLPGEFYSAVRDFEIKVEIIHRNENSI